MKYFAYLVVVASLIGSGRAESADWVRAVIRDDAAALQRLIAQGTDPNEVDENGQSAIGRALLGESYGVALVLARHPKLEVDRPNRAGETALMLAALKGREDIMRVLIDRGAALDPPQGWTPLHYAAAGDALPVLRMLLGHKVRVDPIAPNGRTPLMLAAAYASEEVVDTLLSAGADAGTREPQGRRAADFARSASRDRLAERLEALAGRAR